MNRAKIERELAAALGKNGMQTVRRIMSEIGDPPKPENIKPQTWRELDNATQKILSDTLERVYLESAQAMIAKTPYGADWDAVNANAQDWASRYSYSLVRGINDTTRRLLQRRVNQYYEQGQTIGDLRDALLRSFGVVRADSIAITEVTRASSEGMQAIAQQLSVQGVEVAATWNTSNDEITCKVCRPRNRKRITAGQYPPAHPRCRCSVTYSL